MKKLIDFFKSLFSSTNIAQLKDIINKANSAHIEPPVTPAEPVVTPAPVVAPKTKTKLAQQPNKRKSVK